MKNIAIYGAGGLGRETAAGLMNVNRKEPTWNFIGFFDDGANPGSENEYGMILGGIDTLNQWSEPLCVVMCIASCATRKNIVEKIQNPLVSFPNIVLDPIIVDDNNFSLGQGNIIQYGTIFSCNCRLGDFNVVNGNIIFGHDCIVGSYNSIMGRVFVSGGVTIDTCNYIGIGSLIIQGLRIGHGVTLGAGAVLMTKPKDNSTYLGNPAKIFKY